MKTFRQLIVDIFKPLTSVKVAKWKELGVYTAMFTPFGNEIWNSDVVRDCIRALSEHTSKARAVMTGTENHYNIARILNLNPNMYMSGADFLSKVRIWVELKNTAFIYIDRDDAMEPKSFYPVPYKSFEAVEYAGNLFIKFSFDGTAAKELVLPWADLVVLRKDYNKSDIAGDKNDAILETLKDIRVSKEGNSNAVRATANLRGILKSTKAMLSPDDIKKQKDAFVSDYLNLENSGGIASLDATQEFTPITMSPTITNASTLKEYREDVYRYFGVSEAIVTSNFTEAEYEAFFISRIEPFLVKLGQELTRKVFTERQLGFNNEIVYEANRLRSASLQTKLKFIDLVDRGIMNPNEVRAAFNLAPIEGGDEFVRRLDTAPTGQVTSEKVEVEENGD